MTETLELQSGSGQPRLSTCAKLDSEPVGWGAAGRLDWALEAGWPLARWLLLCSVVLGRCRAEQSAVQESFLKEKRKFLGPPPVHSPVVPFHHPIFFKTPLRTCDRTHPFCRLPALGRVCWVWVFVEECGSGSQKDSFWGGPPSKPPGPTLDWVGFF